MTKSARRIHRQRVSKRHLAEKRGNVSVNTGSKSNVTPETISMWKNFAIVNNEKLAKDKELAKIAEEERVNAIRFAKEKRLQRMQQGNFGRKYYNDGDDKPVFHKSDNQQHKSHEKLDEEHQRLSKPTTAVKVIRKPVSAE